MDIEKRYNKSFSNYKNGRKLWLEQAEVRTFQHMIAKEHGLHIPEEEVREIWADYSLTFHQQCLPMMVQRECVEVFDGFMDKYEK